MDFKTATIEDIKAFGATIGQDIANNISIVSYINEEANNVSDIMEDMNDDSGEAFEHYKCYSPFEFYAKELNERDDADDAWQALEDGYYKAYSDHVESIKDDIVSELQETSCRTLDIEVPAWIDQDITLGDVEAIQEGGCTSGAYMPAVTYYQTRETMNEHGDAVLDYIQDSLGELPAPSDCESWSGIAVHYLSIAVELWAGSIDVEELEG